MQFDANCFQTRSAEFASCSLCALLDFHSSVHSCRSYAEYAWPRRDGAFALLGQLASRARGLAGGQRQSVEAGPSVCSLSRSDLFSHDFVCSGGCSMKSQLVKIALAGILSVGALPAWGQTGGELHFCLRGEPRTF